MAERKKAQDVFNDKKFIFSSKSSFVQAFPTILNIQVIVEEDGEGLRTSNGRRVFNAADLGEYINCSNPICYNGGFNIGDSLREMVFNKENHLEYSESCQGYEGSPNGKRKYRSCINSFEVEINIEYINPSEETDPSVK